MIRRPKYLDQNILRDVADYLDLESPDVRDIRRTSNERREGRAGLRYGVEAGVTGGRDEATEESFSVPMRPARLLTTVIEELQAQEALVDPSTSPERALPHRAAIEVSGKLSLSPVSEIATLFEMFVPLLQSGSDLENVPQEDVARMLFDQREVQAPGVMTLEPTAGPYRFVMVLQPDCLYRTPSFEELEGEFTVFGTLDGPLGDGDAISLERYLLPGLPRALRRAIGQKGISELLEGLAEATGRKVDVADLSFSGPGGLMSVAAIYP